MRLTVGDKQQTVSFEVKMDPRVRTSSDDLRKQFELILKVRDRQDEMNKKTMLSTLPTRCLRLPPTWARKSGLSSKNSSR